MFRQIFSKDAMLDYTDFGGKRTGLEASIEWLDQVLSAFAGVHHNMTTQPSLRNLK